MASSGPLRIKITAEDQFTQRVRPYRAPVTDPALARAQRLSFIALFAAIFAVLFSLWSLVESTNQPPTTVIMQTPTTLVPAVWTPIPDTTPVPDLSPYPDYSSDAANTAPTVP